MKVWPTSDAIRKILKHPIAGKFREQGPMSWPNDTFTHRRIRDGDITTTEPKAAAAPRTERKTSTDAATKSAASSKGE